MCFDQPVRRYACCSLLRWSWSIYFRGLWWEVSSATSITPRHRNTPMALYSGSALAGTGMGPLISGFIVERCFVEMGLLSPDHIPGYRNGSHVPVAISKKLVVQSFSVVEQKLSISYFEELEQTGYLPQPTSNPDNPSEKLHTTPPTKPLRYISRSRRQPRLHHHTSLPQPDHALPPPRNRTRRLLLLPLGFLRLGPPLHDLRRHPPRLHQASITSARNPSAQSSAPSPSAPSSEQHCQSSRNASPPASYLNCTRALKAVLYFACLESAFVAYWAIVLVWLDGQ